MKKNVASQVVGVQMIDASDGSAFTSTVTVVITVDGGTQSASGGTGPTHEGNGFFTYLPTQAETNGDHIGFTFTGSGAIPATVQVYTNFPQSVDNDTLAAGANGFAAIKAETALIVADTSELQTNQGNWLTVTGHATEAKQDVIDANVDLILADTGELQTNQGNWLTVTGHATEAKQDVIDANVDLILTDTGTTLDNHLTDIKGGTFNGSTDSLEAIRDRGDAAWTTGAGGTPPQLLQNTTIATLSTQTSFTLTAGSADNDAYNGAVVVVTDSATSAQKAVGSVSDYVGSTKTITLSSDPGIFTMAAGDTIDIIANASTAPSAAAVRAEIDTNSTQLALIVADTSELQTNQGNWLTVTGHATEAKQDVIDANVDLILADTGELQTNQGNWLTVTGHATEAKQDVIDANVDLILTDTGTTLPATLAALPAATDIVTGGAITTSGGIADSNVQKINDVTITGDGSGTPFNV